MIEEKEPIAAMMRVEEEVIAFAIREDGNTLVPAW